MDDLKNATTVKPTRGFGFYGQAAWIGLFQLIFWVIVLMFPLIMFWTWDFSQEFQRRSVATTGTIVKLHVKTRTSGARRLEQIDHEVQFKTEDGTEVTFIDRTIGNIPAQVGQTVPIRYVPDNPEWAKITIGGVQKRHYTIVYVVLIIGWLLSLPLAHLMNRAQRRHFRRYTVRSEVIEGTL